MPTYFARGAAASNQEYIALLHCSKALQIEGKMKKHYQAETNEYLNLSDSDTNPSC